MLVSIVTARAIAAELKSRNIDPHPVLEQAGIDVTKLGDLRQLVSVDSLNRLVQRALQLTRDPALGLFTGLHTPLLSTQLLGPLMLSCTTLREAITVFRHYAPLLVTDVVWSLTEGKSESFFRIDLGAKAGEHSRFFYEYIALLAMRIGAKFCAADHKDNVAVWFQHAAPSYASTYEQVFKCQVTFCADSNRISFPTSLLDHEQLYGDSTLRVMFAETADLLLRERQGKSTADKVRTALRFGTGLASADVKSLAQAVGVSPRALRRKLRSEGASATSLLEEERMRVAREGLRDPERTIKEIAENLGFSEPSAFHRAFKRWTGVTPAKFAKDARLAPILHANSSAYRDPREAHE